VRSNIPFQIEILEAIVLIIINIIINVFKSMSIVAQTKGGKAFEDVPSSQPYFGH